MSRVLLGGIAWLVTAAVAFAQNLSPGAVSVPSGAVVSHDDTGGNSDSLPASYPDKFAWMLFVQVNQKASQQRPVGGDPANPQTNDALWESWADDATTFPRKPNPNSPPVWPAVSGKPQLKQLQPRAIQPQAPKPAHEAEGGRLKAPPPPGEGDPNTSEEVHRNQIAFDYIIHNNLWYREGIAEFFAKASQVVDDDVAFTAAAVAFPKGTIEVKANWKIITDADKSNYHWNYAYNPKSEDKPAKVLLMGLTAMHIISKDLPNWTWFTFEHKDNPGRGDFIGIHDSFGAYPAHTPSRTDAPDLPYPIEALTQDLLKLFEREGMNDDADWGKQWKNYRLKGSQIDFIDAGGRPLLLGNSVTEKGFVQTASCITCHARAAVTSDGASSFPIFGEQLSLPLVSEAGKAQTYNGMPNPSWFFENSGQRTKLLNLQTDFVWAIPMRAKPADPKP